MNFSEDSRVKIPGLIHFRRLGYKYQTKKNQIIDTRNNIFVKIFKDSVEAINGRDYTDAQIQDTIKEIADITDNNKDKGQAFFDRLSYEDQQITSVLALKFVALTAVRSNELRFMQWSEIDYENQIWRIVRTERKQ